MDIGTPSYFRLQDFAKDALLGVTRTHVPSAVREKAEGYLRAAHEHGGSFGTIWRSLSAVRNDNWDTRRTPLAARRLGSFTARLDTTGSDLGLSFVLVRRILGVQGRFPQSNLATHGFSGKRSAGGRTKRRGYLVATPPRASHRNPGGAYGIFTEFALLGDRQ